MRLRVIATCCGLALFAGTLIADEWTKRTVVAFNEPVTVVGNPLVTLDPGTYVIRLINHDHNRNIVQVFNEREDKLFTTVLAIPAYRIEPREKSVFRFYETPSGNPIALHIWFPPADSWGQEFPYPKGLAVKAVHEEPVARAPVEAKAEVVPAPVEEVTSPVVAELKPEASVPEAAQEADRAAPEEAQTPLPATASPLFTLGLLGVLVGAVGFGLRKAILARG
jgi:hypothetical protein